MSITSRLTIYSLIACRKTQRKYKLTPIQLNVLLVVFNLKEANENITRSNVFDYFMNTYTFLWIVDRMAELVILEYLRKVNYKNYSITDEGIKIIKSYSNVINGLLYNCI